MFKKIMITLGATLLSLLMFTSTIATADNDEYSLDSRSVLTFINATLGAGCILHAAGYHHEIGTVVPIHICEPHVGFRFSRWESYPVDVEFADATAFSTTFIVPDTDYLTIRAIFVSIGATSEFGEVIVAINTTPGASCDLNTGEHNRHYKFGSIVPIRTCGPQVGYRFSHWESFPFDVEFADATALATTFVVPETDFVIITANFVQIDEDELNIEHSSFLRTNAIIVIIGITGIIFTSVIAIRYKSRKIN